MNGIKQFVSRHRHTSVVINDFDLVGINTKNCGGINFREHLREVGREIFSRKGANPIFSESAGEREAFPV